MSNSAHNIDTILAQIGNGQNPNTGSLNTPVYFSTTYQHPTLGASTGYDYTRTSNPTRSVLEDALAQLENGTRGFATSSGMSAIQLALSIFPAGSHFVTSRDLYGGSFRYFDELEQRELYSFTYCHEEADFAAAITEKTVAFFIESPTNPLMREVSIEKLSQLAHAQGLLVIVDNTFLTPLLQRPLELGADIVIHSATKYLGGHNDVLAGAVIVKDQELGERLFFQLNTTGAVLSPFDSWLLIRGLKTLSLRMTRHEENARAINAYLTEESLVTNIYYPNRGGMLSFTLADETKIKSFLSALNLFTFAESLGGVESLITYPTTQTHADIPAAERQAYGLTPDLLRLSVGIEAAADLINDLAQAFAAIKE